MAKVNPQNTKLLGKEGEGREQWGKDELVGVRYLVLEEKEDPVQEKT